MKLSSAGLQQRLLDAGQILEWPPPRRDERNKERKREKVSSFRRNAVK
jgi:hypothetical protein